MWKKKSSDTRVLVDLGLCVLGCGFVPIMDSSSFSFSYSSFGYGFVLAMGSSSGYGFVLAVGSFSSSIGFFLLRMLYRTRVFHVDHLSTSAWKTQVSTLNSSLKGSRC